MVDISKFLTYVYEGREKLWAAVSHLFGSSGIRIYAAALVGLNLLDWLAAYRMNAQASQDLVVLHYNIDFGVNLIGAAGQIYTIPLLGSALIIINFILVSFVFKKNRFLAHVLLGGGIFANLILLLGTASIALINFY